MFLHNAKKKMLQVADRLFVQPISPMAQMIQWTAIRYLYLLLALLVLKGQWYVGAGSYGIDFVFWKEFAADGKVFMVHGRISSRSSTLSKSLSTRCMYFTLFR